MFCWDKLLSEFRKKDGEVASKENNSTKSDRTEIERDYDRILFLSATRRLADKTQVFPMEVNDSVRTRLTHSYEVSNLARSVGTRLAYNHTNLFNASLDDDFIKRNLPVVLASAGLIHDLGNPPFGHQGEKSIGKWFEDLNEKDIHNDFINFDGNRQTIRLISKLHILNNDFGLDLTFGTLSALIKYPVVDDDDGNNNDVESIKYKKHGIYNSDLDLLNDVNDRVGLEYSHRNPLAFIMEACDDIAYSIIDAEDTVKKRYASFNDLIHWLESGLSENPKATREEKKVVKKKFLSMSIRKIKNLEKKI